jgi:hypothetical protein
MVDRSLSQQASKNANPQRRALRELADGRRMRTKAAPCGERRAKPRVGSQDWHRAQDQKLPGEGKEPSKYSRMIDHVLPATVCGQRLFPLDDGRRTVLAQEL